MRDHSPLFFVRLTGSISDLLGEEAPKYYAAHIRRIEHKKIDKNARPLWNMSVRREGNQESHFVLFVADLFVLRRAIVSR